MKTKKKLLRFLSLFLAVTMLLNLPMSAFGFEDVRMPDTDLIVEENTESEELPDDCFEEEASGSDVTVEMISLEEEKSDGQEPDLEEGVSSEEAGEDQGAAVRTEEPADKVQDTEEGIEILQTELAADAEMWESESTAAQAEDSSVLPVISVDLPEEEIVYAQGDDAEALSVTASLPEGTEGTLAYEWYQVSEEEGTEDTLLTADEETPWQYCPSTETVGTASYYVKVLYTEDGKEPVSVQSKTAVVKVLARSAVPTFSRDLDETEVQYGINGTAPYIRVTAKRSDKGKLTYQWYQNSEKTTEGAVPIKGANSSSYRPPLTQYGTTYYFVVVTNTRTGCAPSSAVSKFAMVTAGSEVPGFTQNLLTGEVNYAVGEPAEPLQVAAGVTDGGTLSYQWYQNTSASAAGGTPIEGAQ